MKYIITNDNSIAIFSETCTHSNIGRVMSGIPVSAGFIKIGIGYTENGGAILVSHCYGNSISLDLGSRREIEKIIKYEIKTFQVKHDIEYKDTVNLELEEMDSILAYDVGYIQGMKYALSIINNN